jgi:NADPH:quinone reductase-like Zn-dependent oxidoreductase
MKAVICTRWGPPEVLRLADVETPVPHRAGVRIRVVATSVTASDCIARALAAPPRTRFLARLLLGWNAPRRRIFGMVVAGEIESVGKKVTSFRPGDQVFGLSQWRVGAYAEYVCWPARSMLTTKPANLSYDEAASLPYGGLLAQHLLRRASIRSGQRVLVYGASGAIGTATVQLAKHLGATVTGVCSTTNLALVQSLGADRVVDYTGEDFTTGAERYDIILDAVGKRKSAAAMLRAGNALSPGGKALSIDDVFPRLRGEDLLLLKRLAEEGALKPVIDRRYTLEEIVEAHRYVEKGHKRGNVIVTVGHPSVSDRA